MTITRLCGAEGVRKTSENSEKLIEGATAKIVRESLTLDPRAPSAASYHLPAYTGAMVFYAIQWGLVVSCALSSITGISGVLSPATTLERCEQFSAAAAAAAAAACAAAACVLQLLVLQLLVLQLLLL